MKKTVIYLIIIFSWLSAYSQSDLDKSLDNVKSIELPIIDSIGHILNSQSIVIDSTSWNNLELDTLEKFNEQFNYSIRGYWKIQNSKILLIKRASTEENIHWVVLFYENTLSDWLMTAYDNSEGFLSINSHINWDRVIIHSWNEFADSKRIIKEYHIEYTEKNSIKFIERKTVSEDLIEK
ncbi:hypothetical protein GCQ56_14755 [Marinifilum sp. N1E240]|uniref:hypothetical protein n=1 Tax=Marinifilum sp. N1E240 TaxID=2608082 RepID=UPI00128B0929|nr:hypothetical protein [Marinifilum sp. N1E240]MPQ48261.1 hypothetical protein [Marinifilum sp. N1E240]